MKILIISSTCSERKYKEICNKRIVKSLDTNQKFFLSIIDGFKENESNDITCVSILPVSYGTYPERIMKKKVENVDNVKYVYCKTLNYPIIRNLYARYQVKKEVRKFLKNNKNEKVLIIADGLFYEFTNACKIIHKMNKKICAIITDIPSFVSNTNSGGKFKKVLLKKYGSLADKTIRENYDMYVYLTKQMNKVCNKNNKPYIVMEGLLGNYSYPLKKINMFNKLPVVMYAGKLNKEFGVLALAEASSYLKGICKIEMYGANGDCDNLLKELSNKNDNLSVNGIIPLTELLIKETEVELLVNPRPNGQYFTEYSFPSKTLEYMSSGTPVLMYKLEGIPEEYNDYLYYIDGYDPIDIANSIINVLGKGKVELYKKGVKAQTFVRNNKNAKVQTKKILEFLKKYE